MLLREICAVLQISEHELLTGSEDTERRVFEKLAGKYLRIARNYRWTQYVLYAGVLVGCLIGNLCAQRCLDWFFIALFGVMVSASLALASAITPGDRVLQGVRRPGLLYRQPGTDPALLLPLYGRRLAQSCRAERALRTGVLRRAHPFAADTLPGSLKKHKALLYCSG